MGFIHPVQVFSDELVPPDFLRGGGKEIEKERRGRKRGVDPAGWRFCFLLAKIEVICRLSLWNPV